MASIRVRFLATKSFTGIGIRWITGSLFQHVEYGTPEETWIGAHIGDGIQERAADYCKPALEYIYDIPCTDAQEHELLRWARSKIGTKYNTTDIVGLMLQARKLTSPHDLICSQFCCEGLLHIFGTAKVLNVLENWAYRITPETLHLSPIFVGRQMKKIG